MSFKLGILASGGLGINMLRELNERHQIVFVLTDKKSVQIISFANENNMPIFIGNPRDGRVKSFIADKPIDILLSINYLFLIETDLIHHPKKMAINVHGSLLPKYRGRTPHVWAIINNEIEVGISAHLIDVGCDTGDVLHQIPISVSREDTGSSILEKFNLLYPRLIQEVLDGIRTNTITATKQDESKATYFGKRTPNDGQINWDWQKERIYNWVRAQAKPYPGAFTFYKASKVVIHKIQFSDLGYRQEDINGKILGFKDKKPIVKTPNGCVELVDFEANIQWRVNENFSHVLY